MIHPFIALARKAVMISWSLATSYNPRLATETDSRQIWGAISYNKSIRVRYIKGYVKHIKIYKFKSMLHININRYIDTVSWSYKVQKTPVDHYITILANTLLYN